MGSRSDTLVAELRRIVVSVLGPRPPEPGERASGYGVTGTIVASPELQPLATDNIWRVVLAGESFGRLVARSQDSDAWKLLQLSDLTDAQSEACDVLVSEDLPRQVRLSGALS